MMTLGMLAAAALPLLTEVKAPDAAHAPETRAFGGISSIAVSPSGGRLWATWYAGKSNGEDSNNYCVLATSADRGETWKEVLIADPDGDGPCRDFDCEVWVSPDGKLRWTWTERKTKLREDPANDKDPARWPGRPYGLESDRLSMLTLDDAENEPQTPYPAVKEIGVGVMMCKPMVTRAGRWLFPVAWWNEENSARVYETRDGEAFTLLGGATLPKWMREFEEHNLVELKDGRIRAYMRALRGPCGEWQAESSDGGRTWSRSRPCDFAHTNARLFVRRLKSGALLMVKNGPLDRDVGRKELAAYVSDDDGETWSGGLVVWKDSCTYPDGDQAPDGTIYLTFDADRFTKQDVHLAVFTEADVRAGKAVSGKVRLDGYIYRRMCPKPE